MKNLDLYLVEMGSNIKRICDTADSFVGYVPWESAPIHSTIYPSQGQAAHSRKNLENQIQNPGCESGTR